MEVGFRVMKSFYTNEKCRLGTQNRVSSLAYVLSPRLDTKYSMPKSTKIRLSHFHLLTPDQQLEALNKLIDSRRGPLRIREKDLGKGQKIFYLGTRTWPQYFLETLELFPAEKEERRRAARNAIEHFITPAFNHSNGNPFNDDLIQKLHYRVYKRSVRGSNYYRDKPKQIDECRIGDQTYRFDSRTVMAGLTTVPKGLSIARIAPTKVVADVRIMVDKVEDEMSVFGRTCRNIAAPLVIDNDLPYLVKHYTGLLESKKIDNSCRSIVLEVQGNNKSHWQAAYTAANTVMKQMLKPAKQGISVMLVPPGDAMAIPQDQELDHYDWLDTISGYLKETAPKCKAVSPSSVSAIQAAPPTLKEIDSDNDD